MSEFNIFNVNGPVRTKVYGMDQDAYTVTEDRMNNFTSYSFEFQTVLALSSVFMGLALGSLPSISGTPFIIYATITILLLIALSRTWFKFNKAKKLIFTKHQNLGALYKNNLIIQNALYGTDKNRINITDYLNNLITNNALSLIVSNDIAGDPDKGSQKTLILEYSANDKTFIKTYPEGSKISLP